MLFQNKDILFALIIGGIYWFSVTVNISLHNVCAGAFVQSCNSCNCAFSHYLPHSFILTTPVEIATGIHFDKCSVQLLVLISPDPSALFDTDYHAFLK